MWKSAIEDAIGKLRNNIGNQGDRFPHITREASPNKHYLWEGNTDWIDGFYTGMIWLGFEYSGDRELLSAARRQLADFSRRFLVRGDDSSYHTLWFDPENGMPLRGGTHQGYQDGSTWTRGQAWGIYGFALSYRYTGSSLYLETSKRLARYFIRHLPDDHVAYWDVDAPVTENTPRDSSASAIAVCGILELLEHLDPQGEDARYFAQSAERAMQSLYGNYSTRHEPDAEGLLKHGSYHVRGGRGTDDYMIWGDYYYLEAMMRLENKRPGYWYD